MKNVTIIAYTATSVIGAIILTVPLIGKQKTPPVPKDNPLAAYRLKWANDLPWQNVIDIKKCAGRTAPERLADAQKRLGPGGGVIYFPSGIYRFQEDVVLKDGIILRGVAPTVKDAKSDRYYPQARFEFPRYTPTFTGEGTAKETSFKVIRLENPETSGNTGLLNIAVNRGRIVLGEGPDHRAGRNRFVVGCALTNAAGVDPRIPDTKAGQQPWQRFPDPQAAAVEVSAQENVLIANNRLPEGYPDDFTMDGYVLRGSDGKPQTVKGVPFDFNFRPGIKIAVTGRGAGDSSQAINLPSTQQGLNGIIIRDNYVFSTGHDPIALNGKRIAPPENTVRVEPGLPRQTEDGLNATGGTDASP